MYNYMLYQFICTLFILITSFKAFSEFLGFEFILTNVPRKTCIQIDERQFWLEHFNPLDPSVEYSLHLTNILILK